jgi:hypothetical protein
VGNGSSYPDAGEKIRLYPIIRNRGLDVAENVWLRMIPVENIADVTVDSIYVGEIDSFSSIESIGFFEMTIASDAQFDTLVQLLIQTYSTDNYIFTDTIRFRTGTHNTIWAANEDDSDFEYSIGCDFEFGIPLYGPDRPWSGEFLWGTNLSGNYSNDFLSYLTTGTIEIPDGLDPVILRFHHFYQIEMDVDVLYDAGNVQISIDGGSFDVIEPIEGYAGSVSDDHWFRGDEAISGYSKNWEEIRFDLTEYGGSSVKIRWAFGTDRYVSQCGWYIDNIELYSFYPSSIAEPAVSSPKEVGISIFPNPFNSSIHIDAPTDARLTIYDINGNKIADLTGNNKWTPELSIESGIYIIQAESSNWSILKKVVYLK